MAGARAHPPLQGPKKIPINVKAGTKRPPTRRAVLYTVSGTPGGDTNVGKNKVYTDPANASVFIDDALPARAGYTLPANFGPVYAAGVTKVKMNGKWVDVNGPYICDPDSLAGGSWVLVDMDTRSVVAVLQGTSSQQPSNFQIAVTGHAHNGGTDENGQQNPSYIGLDQSNPNPNLGTGPVLLSSPPTFATTDVGYTTFDSTCSFQVDQTIASDWLAGVNVYLVKEGGPVPTAHSKVHQQLPPTIDGNYTPVITGVPFFRDTGWDVYISYVDMAENISAPTQIGTIAQPGLITPTPAAVPSFSYTDAGNITFDAQFVAQLDVGISQCQVLFYLVRHGGPAPDISTTVHTSIPSNASGSYNVKLKNCPSNVAGGWDVYVAYKDFRNSISTPTLLATMESNPSQLQTYVSSLSGTIDSSGDILNVEFPGTAISKTGGLIHVGSLVTSSQAYPLVAGQLIELSVELARVPT